MGLSRSLRRTVALAILAPVAGKAAERAAAAWEQRRGDDAVAHRLRQAAEFVRSDRLRRYVR